MLYNSLQGIQDEVAPLVQKPEIINVIDSLKKKMRSLILQHRVSTQLSNKDSAQKLKIDEGNLSKIISGEKKNLDKISLDSLIKYLEVLAPQNSEIKKNVRFN